MYKLPAPGAHRVCQDSIQYAGIQTPFRVFHPTFSMDIYTPGTSLLVQLTAICRLRCMADACRTSCLHVHQVAPPSPATAISQYSWIISTIDISAASVNHNPPTIINTSIHPNRASPHLPDGSARPQPLSIGCRPRDGSGRHPIRSLPASVTGRFSVAEAEVATRC